jgi:hypothetical protein
MVLGAEAMCRIPNLTNNCQTETSHNFPDLRNNLALLASRSATQVLIG